MLYGNRTLPGSRESGDEATYASTFEQLHVSIDSAKEYTSLNLIN